MRLSTIPPRLLTSQLPTGGREFFCYAQLDDEAALSQIETITWAIVAGGCEEPLISGTILPDEAVRASGRVPVAAVLPPEWAGGQLRIAVHAAGDVQQADFPIQHFEQAQPFRLPLDGPVLVVGGHRLGEVHRLAWQVASQQFAWDLLPLARQVWSVFSVPLADSIRVQDFAGFDCAVLAPGGGTVTHVVNNQPDLMNVGELPDPGAFLEDFTRALGNVVILDHGDQVWSVLAHLRQYSVPVDAGQVVEAGQLIGRLGNSGYSSGPHLHVHFMDGPDPLTASPLPVALDVEGETYAPQAGELIEGQA